MKRGLWQFKLRYTFGKSAVYDLHAGQQAKYDKANVEMNCPFLAEVY